MRQVYYPGSIHTTSAGQVEVLERIPHTKKVKIRFLATGSEKIVYRETIRRGNLKDDHLPSVVGVGFVGTGDYSHKTHSKLYDHWASMLKRCYSCSDVNPSYVGCSVVEEWHNFQTFACWAMKNGFEEGLHLDKDIKVPGNKIYGPNTCLFVTARENIDEKNTRYVESAAQEYMLIKISSGDVILGKNKNDFIRKNNLNRNFFSMLERGIHRTSKGYRLPTTSERTAYFALAGECAGNK